MNKFLTLILALCVSLSALADLKVKDGKIEKIASGGSEVEGTGLGSKNMTSAALEWPTKDPNNHEVEKRGTVVNPVVLVRINFEGIPDEEIDKIKIVPDDGNNWAGSNFYTDNGRRRYYLFMSSQVNRIDVNSSKYGTGRILVNNIEMDHHDIWEVTIITDQKQNITIRPKLDPGVECRIVLDGKTAESQPSSNARFEATFGKHTITNNINAEYAEITVDENHNVFEPDWRHFRDVTIKSKDKGCRIIIDDEELQATTPATISLPYGTHTVKVLRHADETDERNITINATNPIEYTFDPVRRKAFTVAVREGNTPVAATLIVNGQSAAKYTIDGVEGDQEVYSFNRPIGETLEFQATNYSSKKSKTVKVTDNMSTDIVIALKKRSYHTMVWPWQRDFDAAPMGVSVGYVRKQLVTSGEGEKLKENGVWPDDDGSWLNGIQAGIHFQPALSWGLGLYTGIFYEFYYSTSDEYDDYNKFQEHNIYVPAHLMYRLRLAERASIAVHGGLGFNYAVYGAYTDSDDFYEDYTDFYGEDGWPKRFNMAAEISVSLRIHAVAFTFTWAKGITDHKSYSSYGDYKTVQNKMAFGLSYVFSAGN